jgi:mannose-6-phosphate isomerase-like protein (cupin superfamily)
MNSVINLSEKLSLFQQTWSPKIVASLNDYHIKLAKLKGEFVWHSHPETDEMFLIVNGQLTIELHGQSVHLKPGDMFVVPRGVEHKPVATEECHVLLIEPAGTVNTGDAATDRTAPDNVWI